MGIDFTAVIDHSLSWEKMVRLKQILDRECSLEKLPPPIPLPNPEPKKGWKWYFDPTFNGVEEELFEKGFIFMTSASGFFVTLYRKGLDISHSARWYSFLQEKNIQLALRSAVQHIGRVVGGETAIYLPDSYYKPSGASDLLFDDNDISDVVLWLEENCGPPAKTIEDIYSETEEFWNGDGYFIEKIE